MAGGKVLRSRDYIHPLMVLAFDVYADPAERTIGRLQSLGFDLSKIHEDTWQGRPVYVVGAESDDLRTKQFWVDQERLYFVRMLEPDPRGGPEIAETQFNQYQKLKGGWMSVELIFSIGDKVMQKEEYDDVHGNISLPAGLFELTAWQKPDWVSGQ